MGGLSLCVLVIQFHLLENSIHSQLAYTACSLSQTTRRIWGGWGGSHQMSIWLAAAFCILWPSLATEMNGKNSSLAHITLPPSHEVLPWANSVLNTRITLGEERESDCVCLSEIGREGQASCAQGEGEGEGLRMQKKQHISREVDGRKVWTDSKPRKYRGNMMRWRSMGKRGKMPQHRT